LLVFLILFPPPGVVVDGVAVDGVAVDGGFEPHDHNEESEENIPLLVV
jgi:hypothetical protein